jgi:hypothetical protein
MPVGHERTFIIVITWLCVCISSFGSWDREGGGGAVPMVFTIFFFFKKFQNKISACFHEITYTKCEVPSLLYTVVLETVQM